MLFHRKLTKRMRRLRKANDMNESRGAEAVRFLRACSGCSAASPRHRIAAVSCGHVFCYACVMKTGGVCPIGLEPTQFQYLIEDDEAPRQCAICYCDQPMERSFFVECGHAFCSACIWAHLVGSLYAWHCFNCPFCRRCSRFTTLIEEPIKSNEADSAKAVETSPEAAIADPAPKPRSFVGRLARFFTRKASSKN